MKLNPIRYLRKSEVRTTKLAISSKQYESRYYDTLPSGRHQTGDIWTEIPNNGLLPLKRTSALLITPACDLENSKTDTFVFVPVVPLTVALRMQSFRKKFEKSVLNSLKILVEDLYEIADFDDESYRLELRERLGCKEVAPQSEIHRTKVTQYLEYLECPIQHQTSELPFINSGDRTKLMRDIAKNSLFADAHFIPKQCTITGYPAIKQHSVCLFRYLLTFPADLFDIANMTTEETWRTTIPNYRDGRWLEFAEALPVRALRLRHEFLVDAITRLTSLYNRIGSDNFTEACLDQFAQETD